VVCAVYHLVKHVAQRLFLSVGLGVELFAAEFLIQILNEFILDEGATSAGEHHNFARKLVLLDHLRLVAGAQIEVVLALWKDLLIRQRGEHLLHFIHLLVPLVVVDDSKVLESHLHTFRQLLGQTAGHTTGHTCQHGRCCGLFLLLLLNDLVVTFR